MKKTPEGEGAPAPEKPSLSHIHYGNTTELGAAGQFVTSLDSCRGNGVWWGKKCDSSSQ